MAGHPQAPLQSVREDEKERSTAGPAGSRAAERTNKKHAAAAVELVPILQHPVATHSPSPGNLAWAGAQPMTTPVPPASLQPGHFRRARTTCPTAKAGQASGPRRRVLPQNSSQPRMAVLVWWTSSSARWLNVRRHSRHSRHSCRAWETSHACSGSHALNQCNMAIRTPIAHSFSSRGHSFRSSGWNVRLFSPRAAPHLVQLQQHLQSVLARHVGRGGRNGNPQQAAVDDLVQM